MQVRVLLFGVLKEIAGGSEHLLDAPEGATVGTVFDELQSRHAELAKCRSSLLFARNQEFTRPETVIFEGDEIAFLPPVSGGAGAVAEAGVIPSVITRQPIDTGALARSVARDDDGAVVTFEGLVRNNSGGRATMYLEYEAYEQMALTQMDRIAAEIRQQYSVGRVGAVHRLGRLHIGEASVAIAVSAPHRRAAFEAALDFIDRLKREVPIWKKEYFTDGAVWVEGAWDPDLSRKFTSEG